MVSFTILIIAKALALTRSNYFFVTEKHSFFFYFT